MSEKVTKAILLDAVLFVSVSLVGLSASIWAPGSAFGKWVADGYNGVLFIVAIIAVEVVVKMLLFALGIDVLTSKTKNDS